MSITQEEIEQRIEALIADLTIPKYNISALRRRKESANDSRPSAIAVGTSCGVVFLTMTGLFIVIIDLDHVIAVFRYFRRVL